MNRLERLRKELSQMDRDEVLAFIRKTRVERRITKERKSVKRAKRVTAERNMTKATKAIAGMTPEQVQRLLMEMGVTDDVNNEDSRTRD